jgi:hypothetical protein
MGGGRGEACSLEYVLWFGGSGGISCVCPTGLMIKSQTCPIFPLRASAADLADEDPQTLETVSYVAWAMAILLIQALTHPHTTKYGWCHFLRGYWRVSGWRKLPPSKKSISWDTTNGVKWHHCLRHGSRYLRFFSHSCCTRALSGSLWHWYLALVFVTPTLKIQSLCSMGPKATHKNISVVVVNKWIDVSDDWARLFDRSQCGWATWVDSGFVMNSQWD